MHNRTRIAGCLLICTLPSLARATSANAAASESTITVTGAGIPGETYRLAQMYGDWFVTATDAQAMLTMRTLPGAHQAQLSVEWSGKGLTQHIDAAKNADVHASRPSYFDLALTGTGPYGQPVKLHGTDAVTIVISKMDDLTLEATFSGTATGTGPLKIAGVIKLHRATTAEKPTGTFGDCDPAIHDKLAGAEWRSPSECEVKFDAYVRAGLTAALQPVIANLTAQGWNVTNKVEAQSLTSIPRHTETKPFQLNEQQMHQGGAFYVQFNLDRNSPIYQKFDQSMQAAMQKLGAAMKTMNAADLKTAQSGLHDAATAQEEHTTCAISIAINQASVGFTNFKGGHAVAQLPSGGFEVSAPNVQPPSGGDESGGQRVTYVFVGAFAQPAANGAASGSENVQVKGTLNMAKLLAVQNVRIRIQTGTDMAQQVISLIEWKALEQLTAAK
jgi:hypothetical protein